MNVAEMLVRLLADNGVTHIFGVAGDALNPVTDALRRDGRIAGSVSITKKTQLMRLTPSRPFAEERAFAPERLVPERCT